MKWPRPLARRRPPAPPPPLAAAAVPWLLATALATVAPHFLYQPWWLSALAALILCWRAWLWLGRLPLPPRWLLLLVSLGGLAAILADYRTLFGRDVGVSLLVLFLGLKLMELKSRRDGVVVVMLGYFLLLTHYFHSQDIPTGLWMLASLVLVTATLLRLHGDGAARPGQTLGYAGSLVLQALPFMLLLFLLFPRISGPLWGLPRDAYAGRSGLSDTMAPGSLAQLIPDGSIAFRVQFEGPVPPRSRLYWRGPVLEVFQDGRWSRAVQPRLPPQVEVLGPEIAYSTTLEAHNQRWLLALDSPTALPAEARLDHSLLALAAKPLTSRSRQALRSAPDYRFNVEEHPAILQRALNLPAQRNPRSRALARQWAAAEPRPERLVQRALAFFHEEPFHYTLQPPLLGRDGVDEFLFATRRGFCEHYASAFTVLMRAAGVPARVVTGYQGGEVNPVDGYLTVRQSDAHAWAEVWLPGQGWRRVDPTAAVSPERIESGIAAALPAGETLPVLARLDLDWLVQLRNRWEAANNTWNQWVLGYSPERQRLLLERLGMANPDWRTMAAALGGLGALLLALLSFWALGRRSRLGAAERLWQRFSRHQGRHDGALARQDWEGPLDYARRLGRQRPGLAGAYGEIAGLYVALRYGPPLPPEEQRRLLQQLAACIRALPSRRDP